VPSHLRDGAMFGLQGLDAYVDSLHVRLAALQAKAADLMSSDSCKHDVDVVDKYGCLVEGRHWILHLLPGVSKVPKDSPLRVFAPFRMHRAVASSAAQSPGLSAVPVACSFGTSAHKSSQRSLNTIHRGHRQAIPWQPGSPIRTS